MLVLSAGAGLLAGTVIGFATAADRIGVPPLLGAAGLLLGLVVAASTRLPELKRRPPSPTRRPRAAAPPEARSGHDSAETGETTTEDDDQWVVPPGWYPDPRGTQPTRYWDGGAWTDEAAEVPTA